MKLLKAAVNTLLAILIFAPVGLLAYPAANDLLGLAVPGPVARYITEKLVNVNSSGNLVLPVAASKKLSVTVNGTEKASVSSGGLITGALGFAATAGGLTATAGDITATAGNLVATAGNLTFGAASAKIIPGATSLLFRNNADGATNVSITDAGLVTTRDQINTTGIQVPAANFETVAGAGSTVSDAAALSATKHVHQLTGANGTVGWKFASATAGQVEILLNTTAGVPKVYAVSGGTCNGGAADAACTLVTGIVAHICYATAANAWICS